MNLSEWSIRQRMDMIVTMPDTFVTLTRTNPDVCENCGQRWPVYRYRLFKSNSWDLMRTYCMCGFAQWPGYWLWNLTHAIQSHIWWLKLCWRWRRWVPYRAYFP